MLNAEHQHSRVRAFSVGSRAKVPRSEYLYRGVLLPSQVSVLNAHEQQNNNNNNNNNSINSSGGRGKKSSSAPILNIKGHNSIDPMDDLMEIDYSRKDDDENLFSSTPIKTSLPVPVPNTISMNSSYKNMNISPKAVSGRYSEYVEMKPQVTNSNDSMSQLSQSKEEDGYLNMRPVGLTNLSKSPSLSSSPIKTFSSPKTVPLTSSSFASSLNKSDYMDMSSRSLDKIQNLIHDEKVVLVHHQQPKTTSDDYLHMLPGSGGGSSGVGVSKIKDSRVLGTDILTKTSSAPEGYMEMSWSKETKTLNNNTITEKPSSDEYISMNFSNTRKSQPITIQSTPKTSAAPAYLHLNTNLDITSAGGKRIRCDSKDSGIFPFSPSSPMKHFSTNPQSDSMEINTLPRKCLVDGRSGTIKLSEEEDFSIDPDTPPPIIQDPTKILNTEQINPVLESLSNDYADMRLGSSHQIKKQRDNCGLAVIKSFDEPDYVNCNPAQKKSLQQQIPLTKIDDNSGDYAFMNPSKPIKKSLLVQISSDKIPSYIGGGFKPIQTNSSEFNLINQKPLINRKNDSGGYEILQVRSDNSLMKKKRTLLSRPNSVNGEKISSKNSSSTSNLCNRPNSANSERLPAISSSSSSSTLCSTTSSTSTLCGSKCQSPSTRPQSFADSGSSRPESVSSITDSNHITSRPPSVSSERELHYASLDLPPSKMETDEQSTGELINSSSANTSPNISGTTSQQQPAFTYAQIDFVKSEGLKNQTKVNN